MLIAIPQKESHGQPRVENIGFKQFFLDWPSGSSASSRHDFKPPVTHTHTHTHTHKIPELVLSVPIANI
jgi:hypothetical protein